MPTFVNPHVPFEANMPGFPKGSILEIQGMVDSDAERFNVNLHCNEGIAFHLNPRFTEGEVVRNSRLGGSWGKEERCGGIPLERGKFYKIQIKAESTKYSIIINDVQVCTYDYRFSELDRIDKVEVGGNINLTYVKF